MQPTNEEQLARFAELARALKCDEDEARWEERLKAVAKHRPATERGKSE